MGRACDGPPLRGYRGRSREHLNARATSETDSPCGAIVAEIQHNLSRAEDAHGFMAEDMARRRDDHQYSLRQIAEEVGCGKTTVGRHLKWWQLRESNPALEYGETVRALKAPKPEPVEPVEVEAVEPGERCSKLCALPMSELSDAGPDGRRPGIAGVRVDGRQPRTEPPIGSCRYLRTLIPVNSPVPTLPHVGQGSYRAPSR
jgi:hypothetical protein